MLDFIVAFDSYLHLYIQSNTVLIIHKFIVFSPVIKVE